MALKCLLVAVLFISPSVFGRDCNYILDNYSTDVCDECIRCGGKWCSDVEEKLHCIAGQSNDNWCYGNQEKLPDPNATVPSRGEYFDPLQVEKRASVGSPTMTSIKILQRPAVKSALVPRYEIVDSTQTSTISNKNIKIEVSLQKESLVVTSLFDTEFCSLNSTTSEFVHVKVGLRGVAEEVLLTYHVPCACSCSDRVEKNSPACNGVGDLSCGVCHCKGDRSGPRCENKCLDRGDNPPTCVNPSKPEMNCSGNGRCNKCNECECFTDWDIEGSLYFDPDNYCEDLCSSTNKCADCLKTNELGHCDQCDTAYVYIMNISTDALEERIQGRKVWVHCNVTVDCGEVQYAAKQSNGEKHVVILKGCQGTYLGVVAGSGITVPVVSGLLAVVAMLAAAAVGYVVWKGKGAAPLPLTSPEYTNIDAEDCTGVNPLYKPPTSSFKNPMYGKS